MTRTLKLYADGADIDSIVSLANDPTVSGFTTNPTLMRQVGITDYTAFAQSVLEKVTDKPISFEVFSDDLAEMGRQARTIASWGANVYVKIPVTNTLAEPTTELVRELSAEGIKLNITAIMTVGQVVEVASALTPGIGAVISVFAGRIADSGRDPIPYMTASRAVLDDHPGAELLWASPREVLNLRQAADCGCDIITMTPDLLAKQRLFDKDLNEFSLDTVKMFRNDAVSAGFTL